MRALVWFVVIIAVALGCLEFASDIAAEAVFSLSVRHQQRLADIADMNLIGLDLKAVALDLSYGLPIACRLLFEVRVFRSS
jgi:hypothetical protein